MTFFTSLLASIQGQSAGHTSSQAKEQARTTDNSNEPTGSPAQSSDSSVNTSFQGNNESVDLSNTTTQTAQSATPTPEPTTIRSTQGRFTPPWRRPSYQQPSSPPQAAASTSDVDGLTASMRNVIIREPHRHPRCEAARGCMCYNESERERRDRDWGVVFEDPCEKGAWGRWI